MKIKEKMTDMLSLPKEIILDLPLLIATGRQELNIENYKNLIEFTDTKIRILTKAGVLTIEGQKLILKQVTSEHVLITGTIKGILW
ncbi:MAG: sporulation protein YqfC [Defluviitaleaceae bacterium]|nr:sporulation protein YqfC [Defluviitaleaceae bacterium]